MFSEPGEDHCSDNECGDHSSEHIQDGHVDLLEFGSHGDCGCDGSGTIVPTSEVVTIELHLHILPIDHDVLGGGSIVDDLLIGSIGSEYPIGWCLVDGGIAEIDDDGAHTVHPYCVQVDGTGGIRLVHSYVSGQHEKSANLQCFTKYDAYPEGMSVMFLTELVAMADGDVIVAPGGIVMSIDLLRFVDVPEHLGFPEYGIVGDDVMFFVEENYELKPLASGEFAGQRVVMLSWTEGTTKMYSASVGGLLVLPNVVDSAVTITANIGLVDRTVKIEVDSGFTIEPGTTTYVKPHGSTLVLPAIRDPSGHLVVRSTDATTPSSYQLVGWFSDPEYHTPFVSGITEIVSDMVLYPQIIEKSKVTYTVRIYQMGLDGTYPMSPITVVASDLEAIVRTFGHFVEDQCVIALDCTGFSNFLRSAHFVKRCRELGMDKEPRSFTKGSFAVDTKTHIVMSARFSADRKHDMMFVDDHISDLKGHDIGCMLMDKGYDSEDIHRKLRRSLGCDTIIPCRVSHGNRGCSVHGMIRNQMLERLKDKDGEMRAKYNQRPQAETANYMIKAHEGSHILSVLEHPRVTEGLCMVIAHNCKVVTDLGRMWEASV